jgi:hypothetical protein
MSDKNPKQYWSYLNKLKPKSKITTTPTLEELQEHFKELNTNTINDNRFNDTNDQSHYTSTTLNSTITKEEIEKCITNLKNSKTPSPFDNILNEYIKSTKHLLMPVYCKLFNYILETGFIPQSWLNGIIIPIFKNKGDPKDPSNYRPITILSCLSKLFTSILNNRLTKFLNENNILDENQAGFRKGYSCSDHIFTLHSLIELMKKKKQKLYCAFIDFSQAFDKVWRTGLWHKLIKQNITGKFLTLVQNMYSNIKSSISLNGNISEPFISEIGVRQGENLSPLLFSLFLNDLQTHMHLQGSNGIELTNPEDLTLWLKLLILLYADDTVIISDSKTDFQNSLNIFHDYCENWHLKINLSKTKIIIFGARQLQNFHFTLGIHPIDITDRYHYLGITLSSNGSFLNARKHLAEQATKAMHLLYIRANNAELPIDLILKLFDHTVLPILTYGSEIFGFENIDILERVHNNFLRKITKARKSTPISFLYGELGRHPIAINIKTRMISFWCRTLQGKEQKISHQIYKYMMNLPNSNFKWSNKIKEILTSVNQSSIWDNQFQINQINIHRLVKSQLLTQFKTQWHHQLQQTHKGQIYTSFKQSPSLENYLIKLTKKEYIYLFQFRTANHWFPVETGRYDGTPFEDRVCRLCNSGQVGTEHHYLLNCDFFDTEREQFLGNDTHNASLSSFLSSESLPLLKNTSKFIRFIFSKFKR